MDCEPRLSQSEDVICLSLQTITDTEEEVNRHRVQNTGKQCFRKTVLESPPSEDRKRPISVRYQSANTTHTTCPVHSVNTNSDNYNAPMYTKHPNVNKCPVHSIETSTEDYFSPLRYKNPHNIVKTCPVHYSETYSENYPLYSRNSNLPNNQGYSNNTNWGKEQYYNGGYGYQGQTIMYQEPIKESGSHSKEVTQTDRTVERKSDAVGEKESSSAVAKKPSLVCAPKEVYFPFLSSTVQSQTSNFDNVVKAEQCTHAPVACSKQDVCPKCPPPPMVTHCPAYDYLTFNQFRELSQLFKFTRTNFFRFLFLLLFTIVYFLLVYCLLVWLIETLTVGFGDWRQVPGPDCTKCVNEEKNFRRQRNFWDALQPRATDLWKQCY